MEDQLHIVVEDKVDKNQIRKDLEKHQGLREPQDGGVSPADPSPNIRSLWRSLRTTEGGLLWYTHRNTPVYLCIYTHGSFNGSFVIVTTRSPAWNISL